MHMPVKKPGTINPFKEVSLEEAALALATSRRVVVTKRAMIWDGIRGLEPKAGVVVAPVFISYKKLQSTLPIINRQVIEAGGKAHFVAREFEGKLYIIRDL
jgi:hypothetical protein